MERPRSTDVDGLLARALDLQPTERASFLRRTCAGNQPLFDEVASLLRSHERAGAFLEASASRAFEVLDGRKQTAPVFKSGELVAGRFEIRRFCERGGMGEVYEAHDRELNETVALKTIRPEIAQNPDVVSQFKREIRLAKKVTHPNVCRVHDVFHDSRPRADGGAKPLLLSMEWLPGRSLASHLDERGPMSWDDAFPILRQIAQALEAAHRADVVHRDLKPSNVMLVPDGDGMRAVITDFGLAHGARRSPLEARRPARQPSDDDGTRPLRGGDDSSSRSVWGTPDYMSPEQRRGEDVDARADIFAAGVIAHEMLTGRPASRQYDEIERTLATPVQEWIRRCLAARPDARTKSAAAALKGLDNVTRRLSRRRWVVRGSAVLTVAALTGSFLFKGYSTVANSVLRAPVVSSAHVPEASQLYGEAMAEIRRGRNLAAIPMLEHAVRLDSRFALAWARLAELLSNTGALSRAEEVAARAHAVADGAESQPNETLLLHAILQSVANDPRSALEAYRQLVRIYPSDVSALHGLADNLRKVGRYDEAKTFAERALEIDPNNVAARQLLARIAVKRGHLTTAIAMVESDLAAGRYSNEESLGGAYHLIGRAYMRDGKHRRALERQQKALGYYEAIGHSNGIVSSLLEISSSHRELGRLRQVEVVLTAALETDGITLATKSVALQRLGNLALELGEPARALAFYRRSLEIAIELGMNGESAIRMDAAAEAHRLMGEYADAIVYLDGANFYLDKLPDSKERPYNQVVRGPIAMAQGRHDVAISMLEGGRDRIWGVQSRDAALARHAVVTIYMEQGRVAEAHDVAIVASRPNGTHSVASVIDGSLRSLVFTQLGDLDAAEHALSSVEAAARALEDTESHQFYLRARGTLLRARGELEASDRALNSAIADSRERRYVLPWSRAMLELGWLRLDQDRPREALELFEETLSDAIRKKHTVVESHALLGAASALTKLRQHGEAIAAAREARDLTRTFGGTTIRARASRLLVQIAHDRGDDDTSFSETRRAQESFQEVLNNVPRRYVASFAQKLGWCDWAESSVCGNTMKEHETPSGALPR